jgi:hypothetical protein
MTQVNTAQIYIQNDNDNMQNKNTKTFTGCIICISVFIIACFLTLPIVNLAYSGYYKNEISCNFANITNVSDENYETNLANTIGVATWLNVNGAISIFETFNFAILVYSFVNMVNEERGNSCMLLSNICSYLIAFLTALFRTAWLIVGAVLFWRDCPNVSPKPINDLMWATLIMGFIGLTSSYGSMGGRKR